MEKIYDDPDAGAVTIRKNVRSHRVTLRVNPRRGVTVTVPYFVPYKAGLEFFLAKKDWVLKVQARQRERIGAGHIPTPEEIEELRRVAKEVLPKRLRELAERYSFEYNSVRIKHNSSNWGSCSPCNGLCAAIGCTDEGCDFWLKLFLTRVKTVFYLYASSYKSQLTRLQK